MHHGTIAGDMDKVAPRGRALACSPAGRHAARAVADRFLASLHGEHHLPGAGGALLVGNHAYLGLDAVVLGALLVLHAGTLPRFLADRHLFRVPLLRSALLGLGVLPGTPEDAVALLEAGELLAVYPGGVDDSFKLSSQAYTLQWGRRAGFARVAMRAGVPIVPIAATGVDELFRIDRREHVLGRRFTGSPRYDLPLPRRLRPRRVPLDFHVLPPIDTEGDPENPTDIERVRCATEHALEDVLGAYRERIARLS